MTKTRTIAALAVSLVGLAACQSDKASEQSPGSGKSAGLRVMEQVAIAAHKCWIASKDPAFKAYSMANELNSYGGNPRFLLVQKKDFGGKPLLIVQARGNSSRVEVFGPLLEEAVGGRIGTDIGRWKSGDPSCSVVG